MSHLPPLLVLLALLGGGCSRSSLGSADAGGDAARRCKVTSTSDLPGVSLVFPDEAECTFTLAQAQAGVAIPYDAIVDDDLAGVSAEPSDAGDCDQPGPRRLILFEQISG